MVLYFLIFFKKDVTIRMFPFYGYILIKGFKMKLYPFILASLIFTACQNQIFGDKSVMDNYAYASQKEILLQQDKWYHVDSFNKQYSIFEFSQDRLSQKDYQSSNFYRLKSYHSYPIEFIDDNHYYITKNNTKYRCTISTCNNDEFMRADCNPQVSGLEPFTICGWITKEKAIKDDKRTEVIELN